MAQTIESEVAKAILQQKEDVTINGTTYRVEQPSLATIIMMSSLASELPDFDLNGSLLDNVLIKAKDCENVAKIAAVMILGAKRVNEHRLVNRKVKEFTIKWSWSKFRFVEVIKEQDDSILEIDKLTQDISENITPSELLIIITKRLTDMQVSDFFALTASLKGVNLTKPNAEAVTPSGE